MFKKILIALGLMIAVFVVVVAVQPTDFRVTRSAAMAATPAETFEQVNDFHKWDAWSPWVKLDPNAKMTYDGPPSGAGAKCSWAGNSDVGTGSMTIVESKPGEQVRIELEFVEPMAGKCDTLFTFKPEGDKTAVTWTMSGKNNFMGKAMSLFIDCDKMMGGEFEKGLANMKKVVESQPAAAVAE
jgi:hypothetical protein